MSKSIFYIIVLLVLLTSTVYSSTPTVVVTFTILEDFAWNICGPNGDVRGITPIYAEIHEWELTPRNFMDLEEADIIFYNGLNVEQWMGQVRAVANADIIPVGQVCGYPTIPIITGDYAGDPDPHIWMDVKGAISYVEVMRDAIIELDPDNSGMYEQNAAEYIASLEKLHEELLSEVSFISPDDRILITSEAAFIYFGDAYGFYHDGIWGTNTEDEGTPRQLMRIIDVIQKSKPKALFWESTITDRYILPIALDMNIPMAGPLYVDSVSEPGTEADNYIGMMRANTQLLIEWLGGR